MTKVLLVGDTHQNRKGAVIAVNVARTQEYETIIQLGDFGFDFTDSLFIATWTDWLDGDNSRRMYWLDGNHDNHEYLDREVMKDGSRLAPLAHWHDRMFYCPRGSVETIGDTKCLFMGGAVSVDKHHRIPGLSWWAGEAITYEEWERAADNGQGAEVMFTHDAPTSSELKRIIRQWIVPKDLDRASNNNREILERLVHQIGPKRLFHGHYHARYHDFYYGGEGHPVRVQGLADLPADPQGGLAKVTL